MAEAHETGLRNIPLVDPDTGESLDCSVAAEFEYEGQTYLVVTPVAEVVSVIRVVGEGDDQELQELEIEEFPEVAAVINEGMKEFGLKVEARSNELILVGELPDDFYEDCDELEVETEDGDDRILLVLQEIDTGEVTYLVAANSGYVLYPALDQGESARPLSLDELASMQAVFDEVYAAMDQGGDED